MTEVAARATDTLDPVKFDVIRNALVEATEEMGLALRRSAYSTNIKTRADFSCVIFDVHLRFVASGFAQPTHLGSMSRMVPMAVRDYGIENLAQGDVIVTNDPYLGGVHLNDIALISPIYHEGELFGFVANIAHHVDVGGGAPASIGAFREVFQEGVIISPVKLVGGGEMVRDTFRLILNQIRSKHETGGDFRAQIAALNTGIRRVQALLDRYGRDAVCFYIDELIAYTERRTQLGIACLPRGVFSAEGQVDNDGYTDDPVKLRAAVVIDEDGIFFDFEGCDPQRRAPVNSTYSQTLSTCAYALKCLIDPDIPPNEGFYRQLRMNAPAGTVVNCTHPAAVVGGFETHTRLVDTIFKALAPVLPDRVPAGTKAMMCHSGFGGADADGSYYCYLETLAGGYGGRRGSDGPDAVQAHGQNTENAPIEETELNYPVRIARYELVDDSDGPGTWRGGLGVRRDYLFPASPATFTILSDRDREGPHGLFGGLPGQKAEYILNPDGTAPRRLSSKCTVELVPGEVVSYRTCGGGGYGPPELRDPALVARDVRDHKVSWERARDVYRTAIARDGSVDAAQTAALRAPNGSEEPQ